MKYQLSNPPFNPSFKLKHTDRLFFIGSCFADAMSRYFTDRKFQVLHNPYGVLYNPVSIANSLAHITSGRQYNEKDFYQQDGMYASWYHHSNLAEPAADILKHKLEHVNQQSLTFLQKTEVAFMTLGTAWVYWHKQLSEVVANNLKAPAHFFEQRLLTVADISAALHQAVNILRARNKNIKIVFTLSPVRHSKQGLAENNLSKARLLCAMHEVCLQDAALTYFPSYEIVLDVLRDYRFYEKDLVHPNELATDYLWDFLLEKFIDSKDHRALENVYKVYLTTQHKLRHPHSAQALKFRNEQLQKIENLENEFTYLDLNKEREYFLNL